MTKESTLLSADTSTRRLAITDALTRPRLAFASIQPDTLTAVLAWPHPGTAATTVAPTLTSLADTFSRLGLVIVDHDHDTGAHLHRLTLQPVDAVAFDDDTATAVTRAFDAIMAGHTDIDGFLRLVTAAGLDIAEVILIRALCRYARQYGLTVNLHTAATTLAGNGAFVRGLLDLFDARLRPGLDDAERTAGQARAEAALSAAVALAASVDEDRLLRALISIVRATLRTNWFAPGVPTERPLALKLNPSAIDLPAKVIPFREIFVHGVAVEGAHLRGGSISRGGLRWSERPDDFRTEVLGLMRTQMVKNSLIVPVGAKGAFVARTTAGPTPDDVRAAYRQFIGALLDVTDNLVDGEVSHPADTTVTDGADPYLVVAADKGTARFSDLANSIAGQRDFWLGDAFASGGSAGYDHKAMGITARGGWLAVQRHLAEAGIDVGADDFTAVGIGDMSGDVFGNGMLRSTHTRLVAAFDHRHIFCDPNPDAASSFIERQRLYDLPGSSWDDYDRTLISEGGGVWPRSAKTIELSDAMRTRLGVDAAVLTPHELIRAILRADVDLLWNGGVGTYVKASTETSADAADPGNELVRVDANTLRATAIGEGGNLGLTQRARVEYALAGGRCNADFIDNAAGVATSDREVNIKIALDDAVHAGRLTRDERDDILSAATDEVARSVLADCDRQTLALSLAEDRSSFLLGRHARLIENLEETNGINRSHEVLPSAGELAARQRAGAGLVRPEIAVLLAMSKNVVRDDILASSVPDDPSLAPVLRDYFPASVQDRLGDSLADHRLGREIIAVTLANDLIDHVGPGFVHRIESRYGVGTPEIVRAYAVVTRTIGVDSLWADVLAMPHIDAADRFALLAMLQSLIEQATGWVLRHRRRGFTVSSEVARIAPQVDALRAALPRLTGSPRADRETFAVLGRSLACVAGADATGLHITQVAQAHREAGERLRLSWLADAIDAGSTVDRWAAMAAASQLDELHDLWQSLAETMVTDSADGSSTDITARIDEWIGNNRTGVERVTGLIDELTHSERVDAAHAVVTVAALRQLVG
ncbi:NAD-glutamate dehydrogenase [Gordonia sp. TBRC 11910]|uniref:NAD-glutamate dehydrogenase n=1 Tax=Gordonia asplenii TaxID=2725283 RepID=A0A848L005_9ACTN|nr:NAD-glutamate dehydrogenase domain-containing protein [Gordonia asplenii]NMO04264.1 NAD-glutamate dehydrogenase [Gordonia asplenii]